ncbi:MAG: heme NO-binding domain-containing protein [Bacteroidota bacterium]
MYGLVNQAIQGLVVDHHGEEAWARIKTRAGVQEEVFLSNTIYDDSVTYNLAGAAAEELGVSLSDVLIGFGKYWVLRVGKEKYGALMMAGGSNFGEFLVNLPNFHSRVMLIYTDITPPEFKVEETSRGNYRLHYYSTRPGLTSFMQGLLEGLSELYGAQSQIRCTGSRADGLDHDIFEIALV